MNEYICRLMCLGPLEKLIFRSSMERGGIPSGIREVCTCIDLFGRCSSCGEACAINKAIDSIHPMAIKCVCLT